MIDKIERFGNSTIQHGKLNNRVYLMSLAREDTPKIVPYLDKLAVAKGYTKIFAKVPSQAAPSFLNNGYRTEASIPVFLNGKKEAHFLGKYFCPQRKKEKKAALVQKVIKTAKARRGRVKRAALNSRLVCRRAGADDAEKMKELYRKVFASYPFPIHDASYLIGTMQTDITYFGIWDGADLLALASAEMDRRKANAEMTDFATHPGNRGRGFASVLLGRLEEAAVAEGIKTCYTIARSYSMGMNITFAKKGYRFSGTLTSNTNISGGLESMNVWYKLMQS